MIHYATYCLKGSTFSSHICLIAIELLRQSHIYLKECMQRISADEVPTYTLNTPDSATHRWLASSKTSIIRSDNKFHLNSFIRFDLYFCKMLQLFQWTDNATHRISKIKLYHFFTNPRTRISQGYCHLDTSFSSIVFDDSRDLPYLKEV